MAKFEIDLNLPDVKILNIEITKAKDLIITVKSIQKSTICHKCDQKITKIHGYGDAILARDFPRQRQEAMIASGALNKMTSLGMPQSCRSA